MPGKKRKKIIKAERNKEGYFDIWNFIDDAVLSEDNKFLVSRNPFFFKEKNNNNNNRTLQFLLS